MREKPEIGYINLGLGDDADRPHQGQAKHDATAGLRRLPTAGHGVPQDKPAAAKEGA